MKEGHIRHAVGVDFGGTSIKVGLVNDRGEIKSRTTIQTAKAATQQAWMDAVKAAVDQLRQKLRAEADIVGIGVGVPGFVDYERGFVHDLANVPGWTGFSMGPALEDLFKTRIRVDNDVNVMALGECTFGAGCAYQHAVFVTLGTGVGGGVVINSRLYRGAYSMAGEIGHIPIRMDGIKSPQGRGGLEQYVGNRRIVERALHIIAAGARSSILDLVDGDVSAVTAEVIAKAAKQGDKTALDVFDYVADCLATAFTSVAYLIQPQAIIIGGGVALSGHVLFDPLRIHLKERLSPVFFERLEVKPAALGNDAGMIGAATLVMME
jgi:glucokinase